MKQSFLRQLIILPLLALALAMLHACGSANGKQQAAQAGPAAAPASAVYVLSPGQSVAVALPSTTPAISSGRARTATLRLDRVNDSRCRIDAVCVWAGYISYSFTVTGPGDANASFVLAQDMPNGVSSISQNGLTYTLLGVEPSAVPAKKDPTPDYRVSLRVTNNPVQ